MHSDALKNLSKHTLLYVSAIAFNKAAGFLIIPLVTAYIGAIKNYGVKEIAEVSIALAVQILGFNVFQGMVRYLAEDDNPVKRGKTLGTSLYLVAGFAGILLAVCLLFPNPIAALIFGAETFAPALRVTAAILFFSVFTRWGLSYLEAMHRSVAYSVITTSKLLLEIALKVVFLVYMNLTYMGVLYSVFLGEVIFGGGLLIMLMRHHHIGFSIETARRLLIYVAPLILGGVCMFVVHQGDRFFIRIFDGLGGVGLYGLGYKLGSIVNAVLYTGFATIWFPFVFKIKDDEHLRSIFQAVLTLFVALSSFLTLILSVFGQELLWLMVAEPFRGALSVLPIIAFSYLFWTVYQLVHTIFFVKEATSNVFTISFLVAVINTALNVVLVPSFGIVGAAWSTLVSYFCAAAVAYFLAQRIFYIRYDIGRLASAICLAGVLWMLSQFIAFSDSLLQFAAKVLICLMYPFLLFCFGYLNTPLRTNLIDMFRGLRK